MRQKSCSSAMSACPHIALSAGTSQAPTVLIAEDEILIRGMAAEYLRAMGFNVLEASNASEAIDVLKSSARVDLKRVSELRLRHRGPDVHRVAAPTHPSPSPA